MRIAFSADSPADLDAGIHPHFGRCPYFVLVEVEAEAPTVVSSIQNPFHARHEPGQVPHFVHQQGVQVMVTGGMGGRAVGIFEQLGIEPVTGATGTVREALARYLSGDLSGAGSCETSEAHGHGTGG